MSASGVSVRMWVLSRAILPSAVVSGCTSGKADGSDVLSSLARACKSWGFSGADGSLGCSAGD
ncbi:hypothetical protein [Moraxella lacunata]|uniref:hypothetical protein n=1 Tax=Moraxella lacunata TaxID=477 RepID=UPI003EDFD1D7